MRQISRLLTRAKLATLQQLTTGKALEYVKSLTLKNGSFRLRIENSLRTNHKLRTKPNATLTQLQKNNLNRDILKCGIAPGLRLNENSFETISKAHKQAERFNDYVKQALNNNQHIYNSLRRRKLNIHDAIKRRQFIFNEMVQTTKGNFDQNLTRRKNSWKDSIEKRKNILKATERKVWDQGKSLLNDIKEVKEVVKGRVEQVIEKENIYTIPNLLCITRIAFSPYLGYLIVTESYEYALIFLAFAGISDWLDGWIARNYKNQSTKIGSFLDPMADKILIGTLFLSLTYVDLIPVPLTALIVGRDVALVIAGFVIRYKSLSPPRTITRYFDASHATAQLAPTFISKINTGIQLSLVASTLAAPVMGYVGHPALDWLCCVTGISTILAAASYVTSKNTYKYIHRK